MPTMQSPQPRSFSVRKKSLPVEMEMEILMKQPERTAPESRIREIQSYGLTRGRGKRSLPQAVNPYPLSTLPWTVQQAGNKKGNQILYWSMFIGL